jgi:hypothetical protein
VLVVADAPVDTTEGVLLGAVVKLDELAEMTLEAAVGGYEVLDETAGDGLLEGTVDEATAEKLLDVGVDVAEGLLDGTVEDVATEELLVLERVVVVVHGGRETSLLRSYICKWFEPPQNSERSPLQNILH